MALLPDGTAAVAASTRSADVLAPDQPSSRIVFEREIGFHPGQPEGGSRSRALKREVATRTPTSSTDRVASLESLGEEDVFDLTEPATQHFVANGLIVHNCSEYMFLDDTACNLASLNLVKFLTRRRHASTSRATATRSGCGRSCSRSPC